MTIVGTTFTVAIIALAAYFAVTLYINYRKAVGTTWQRLVTAAESSATMLWAKFCAILAALVSQLDNIADIAGQPEAKTFIDSWIGNPKIIAAVMLGIAVITMAARKRTL